MPPRPSHRSRVVVALGLVLASISAACAAPAQAPTIVPAAATPYPGATSSDAASSPVPKDTVVPNPSPSTAINFGPAAVAVDGQGRVYFSDCAANRVYHTEPTGTISIVAGNGEGGLGGDAGPATKANLYCPGGLAFDPAGDLFIVDTANNRIRKVDVAGVITTVAGSGPGGWEKGGFGGDGGPATAALLGLPTNIAIDTKGDLFFSDRANDRIRRVDAQGIVSTIVGDGIAGFSGDGGPARKARIDGPAGIAVDSAGNVYFADSNNNRIRRIDRRGVISTLAGTGELASTGNGGPARRAALADLESLLLDANGFLYVGEAAAGLVRQIDPHGFITAFAGTGAVGFSGDGGAAVSAELAVKGEGVGLAIDNRGDILIADIGNGRIRMVDPTGTISTLAGGG
jgi:sugar lactone lactonase YvrE